ncbi:thioesterase family protein [Frankia sp. CNm7]|uniref:Thioesterase family protein n=1 Tax=Frankia nepalensis TaxID=1836974 RepID=A0A937UWP7_9ACTN|nr:thioesterase family protein [Frankia nepalensis]MBL7501884.1 thioesterase family protein [Frankia nepalensis]MBL7511624.1 thioesterase family protein [Frankia nepalensis]MBL7523669.1 thioesterase family protein [Frankia nepalensis]MBL7633616.1 thioesterase family protein [Frankia nepalensis]
MAAGERQAPDPLRRDLARYPWVHDIRARFADVDNLGHINNVTVVAYYEDARATFNNQLLGLWREAGSAKDGPFHFVVAQSRVDYLAEAHYPANYQVGVGIGRIGRSSVNYLAGFFHEGRCLGLCDAVLVHRTAGTTTPIPPDRRAILEKMAFRSEGH